MPIIFPRSPKVVLTGDAEPENVMLGKTFYKDDYRQKLTGTYVPNEPPVLTGNATPEDVLAGKTFYNTDAFTKLTGTIPSKAAATITPGTVDQIIEAGQYLAGAQTIKGDANLIPANIVNGIEIFNVTGSAVTGGAKVKNIQHVVTSFSRTVTTETLTINAVNPSNSILLVESYTRDSRVSKNKATRCVRAEITNNTTITLTKGATNTYDNISLGITVIEFETGVTIQRGVGSPNLDSLNLNIGIDISPVDTSRTFVAFTFSSTSTYDEDPSGYSYFYNNRRLVFANVSSDDIVSWYVVTFN